MIDGKEVLSLSSGGSVREYPSRWRAAISDGRWFQLGGHPLLRDGLTTDNGNLIIDVHGLTILDPVAMETKIGALVGVGDRGSVLTAASHPPRLQPAARATSQTLT